MALIKLLQIAGWILKMTFLLTPTKKKEPEPEQEEEIIAMPMINIIFKDGTRREWEPDSFSGYQYDNENNHFFLVLKDERPIGIYNMDTIQSIEIV